MLDARMILRCHLFVPVWFWPVLWLSLHRLEATAARARADGRKGFMWHLERNGVIWISHMDASEAERAARGELPRDFDRTPWTRLAPLAGSALCARLGAGLLGWLAARLPIDSCDTVTTPLAHRVSPPREPP